MLIAIGKSAPESREAIAVLPDGRLAGWHALLFQLGLSPCLMPEHRCAGCPASAYATIATEYRDAECLVQALEAMGYTVERHEEPQALYGYQNDRRAQRAHIIVRRHHVGAASNDVGFVRGANGSYSAIISEYDQGATFTAKRQNQLKQGYAVRKVTKQAKAKGYQVVEQKDAAGAVKLTLRRY